jgi:hypothetical protein
MTAPAYPVLGVDPDAICSPEFHDLLSIPFMKRGWLIADYTDKAKHKNGWKDHVASLAYSRHKNRRITDGELRKILAWLERNRLDYPMLPQRKDPRFASLDFFWNSDWGWPRNACTNLIEGVDAVVSLKEDEQSWCANPKWRQLRSSQLSDSVPELDEDERIWSVKRDAECLASLIAHPLCFGNILKMIDPHADYERWHPTLDAMLRYANYGIVIELHCARRIAAEKGKIGPSESFRKAWENWAGKQRPGKLKRFTVFFWEELDRAVVELHDRHAIVGVEYRGVSEPFAGVSVGKGWDQARSGERNLETSFSLMSRKDQKTHWRHYCDGSTVLRRNVPEDVCWQDLTGGECHGG